MRHAVYFMPDDSSALGAFGAALFGRWPDGRPATARLHHPDRDAGVDPVVRYGFHATLKAPFRLADGVTPKQLILATEALASQCKPVPLDPLRVTAHSDGYLALTLDSAPPACHQKVADIAARCVQELDSLRAPLSAEERARRKPERLPPQALARLERYGYPWVLDGFHFHITLARGTPATTPVLMQWLSDELAFAGAGQACFDRLAVCREAAPGAPFERVADIPFGR